MSRTGLRPGLVGRLLGGHVFVLLASAVTAALVAAAAGPAIFRGHLGQVAGDPHETATHAEQAFREGGLISLAVGLGAGLAVALVASLFVARRLAAPVRQLAEAASLVASGRYDVRVPAAGIGAEFDTVAASFTAMAERLGTTEGTRRRLLADVAHEIRTPIATIDAYLEAFEDGVATLNPETAAMLRSQTRRLARLTEDIATVSRAEEHQIPLEPVLIPPGELVDAAAAAVDGRFADKGVRLRIECPPDLPSVYVDPERIAQVLGNLLDNALRHTPPGGLVEIRAVPARREVVFSVSDTGSGIDAEHLPHVFTRFYRVQGPRDLGPGDLGTGNRGPGDLGPGDRAFGDLGPGDLASGGSGIGLAIAKALVEAHGGRVEAESPGLGGGATFVVRIPVARG